MGFQCLRLLRDIECVDSKGLHSPKPNITSQTYIWDIRGPNDAMTCLWRELQWYRENGVMTAVLQTAHTAEHMDPWATTLRAPSKITAAKRQNPPPEIRIVHLTCIKIYGYIYIPLQIVFLELHSTLRKRCLMIWLISWALSWEWTAGLGSKKNALQLLPTAFTWDRQWVLLSTMVLPMKGLGDKREVVLRCHMSHQGSNWDQNPKSSKGVK